MSNVHQLRHDTSDAPKVDHRTRRDAVRKAMRDECSLAQKDDDRAARELEMTLAIIAGRRKALDEEEAEARRQCAADRLDARARLHAARAYLDVSQEHGIAAE